MGCITREVARGSDDGALVALLMAGYHQRGSAKRG